MTKAKVKPQEEVSGCVECGFSPTSKVWVIIPRQGMGEIEVCSLRCCIRWHKRREKIPELDEHGNPIVATAKVVDKDTDEAIDAWKGRQ